MSNPNPSPKTRFQAGNTLGRSNGRPAGSRDKLSTEFIDGLLVAFAKHGKAAIEHVAQQQQLDFLKLVASLTPKRLDVDIDQRVTLIDYFDALEARNSARAPGQVRELEGESASIRH